MHYLYTRRIVIALVVFFSLSAVLFGPLVVSLRSALTPVAAAVPLDGSSTAAVLPDGTATYENFCASCHPSGAMSGKLKVSLDPDAASRAWLEKLIGPPAHGGVSPAEALAVVIHLRMQAGLSSTYPESVATPAAAATAAAQLPTPTPVALVDIDEANYEGVYTQYCAACHKVETFSEALNKAADPNLRSRKAVEYLSGPPPHQNLPVEVMKPAINYIRRIAGLSPIR